ncbi:MAG: thiamine pyrophosphate-dependent dehydrogenase E1 component subunit alpha [Clostridiales bacterium]|nr:thiamine pyrophosphate-dependent dehydrogenase E1 component subunit alpha [Clostridiales bacterium]
MDEALKLRLYKTMLRIRKFEEAAQEMVYNVEIPGAVHLYIGQEAIAVGACAAIEEDDYITSTHRGHGHAIAKGGRTDRCMAELYGKKTGYCNGKGGSLHIAVPELNMLGANGIVGAGIPIATGAAFSAKYLENGKIAIAFFGDGAANQGTFHEAVNIASAFKLPCIYICENNLFGVSCRQETVRNIDHISERAAAYGIPGVTIDGNDVEAVYEAVKDAAEYVRGGNGPMLIECMTYRWRGHFEGEPEFSVYRSVEEVREWMEKCPIKRYRAALVSEGVDGKALDEIESDVADEISQALSFARQSEYPDVADAMNDVYS